MAPPDSETIGPPGPRRPNGRLRVAHVSGESGPRSANGVSRAVWHLANAQRALGHDVEVTTDAPSTAATSSKAVAAVKNVPQRRPRLLNDMRLAARFRGDTDGLLRVVTAFGPDIVHLHSIHLPVNVSLARQLQLAGVPYCVTVHGGLFGRRRGRLKKAAFWWLWERSYLNQAQFVHALTEDEAADLRSCGITAEIVVAPNGIALDQLPRPANPGALFDLLPDIAGHRVFMFMGRLDPLQKGLDLLLEAFGRAKVADSRLVLLGPDSKNGRSTLSRLVGRFGLESSVVFLDAAGPERCADLLAGADVFVHPSRWEGVSLAVLEAAAWERPCLLTHAADPMGALGAAGAAVVVDPTVESLSEGIRVLSHLDRDKLTDMGRRAASIVGSTFQWSSAASALIEAYRQPGERARRH
jgi:poly(glycerol-phosphate) alpha-glucosyltransferase